MRLSKSQLCALLLVMSLLGSPSAVEARKRRQRNRKPVFVPYIFSLFGENGEYNLKKKSTASPYGSTMEPTTVQTASETMNSTTAEVKTLSPNGETKSTMSQNSVSLSNSTLLSVIFQANSSMSDTLTALTTTSVVTTTGNVTTADHVTTESYVTTSVAAETNRSVILTEGESTPKDLNEQDVGNSTEIGLSEKVNDKENTASINNDLTLKFNETSSQPTTFQSSTETTIKKAEVFTTLNDEILRFDDKDDSLTLDSIQNISKPLDKDQILKSDSVTKNSLTTTIEKTPIPGEITTLVVPLETTLTTSMPSSTARTTTETQNAEVTTKTTNLQTLKSEKPNTRGKLYSTTISPFLQVLGIRVIRTRLNEDDLELRNANDQGVQGYRAGYLWKSWTHRLWRTRGNQGHKCIVPLCPKFTWFIK